MTIAIRLFRTIQVFSLCFLLFVPFTWAQQSSPNTADDSATLAQDFDNKSSDDGEDFERELTDIETQYSQLVPDSAKSTALKEMANEVNGDEDEESEDEEDE